MNTKAKTSNAKTTETASEQVAKHALSIETAVKAVASALMMGRKALNTELAVCLAVFAAEGNSDADAKAMVTEVYVKAGYDAANSNSRHYKTVNRRVNAAAGLFTMVGAEKVLEWIGKSQEDKMIEAILKGLDEYQFSSMDDVLEFSGRPNNRTQKANAGAQGGADQNQGAADTGDQGQQPGEETTQEKKGGKAEVKMILFRANGVKVEIPESTPSEVMMKIAAKIINAARAKEQEELKAAIAHPSTAPNVAAAVLH